MASSLGTSIVKKATDRVDDGAVVALVVGHVLEEMSVFFGRATGGGLEIRSPHRRFELVYLIQDGEQVVLRNHYRHSPPIVP